MEESICNQRNWSASKIYTEPSSPVAEEKKYTSNTKRARPDNTLNKIYRWSVRHGRNASSVVLPANEVAGTWCQSVVAVKMEHERWRIWAKRILVPAGKSLTMEDPYKTELWYKPVVLLLSLHLQELQSLCQRDTCTSMFTGVQFTLPKVGNPPECPSADVCSRNLYYIYTVEYRVMNLEDIALREISQTQRETHHDLTSMTNLIKFTLRK